MFDTQQKRIWLSVGLGTLLVAATLAEWLQPSIVLQATIPPIAVTVALWSARVAYVWQRSASYERRETRRRRYPSQPPNIPMSARKAESYEGVTAIHAAQSRFLAPAVEAQGAYFANGILAALLPPLALLLLSLQILVFPSGGGWAVGFILAEALCLLVLVVFAWTHPEPTVDWIENRVKAELLRREKYLMVVGVGPYLDKTLSEAIQESMVRLGLIEGATLQELKRLVLLQDGTREYWMEVLHVRGASSLESPTDLADRIKTYLHHRIAKQLRWFSDESRNCGENERAWTDLLKTAVVLAFIVSLVHGGRLLNSLGLVDPAPGLSVATTALGVLLPPVATTLFSIRAMYGFDFRRRLYQRTERHLHEYRGLIQSMLVEAEQILGGDPTGSRERIDFHFRATVLRVEQILSFELEQWLLLMNRTEHEVAA